jgi:hypothetical protein
LAPSSTVCRAAVDACDVAEKCDGVSPTCPTDVKVTCTASDQCHDLGTCNPVTGSCNSPLKDSCTATATRRWTAAATDESLFGQVVPCADGTLLAAGRQGLYRIDASGHAVPFTPALGSSYAFDPVGGAYLGALVTTDAGVSGGEFVLYDLNGVEKQRVSAPLYAGVHVVPGHPIAALRLMDGPDPEHLATTTVRFAGEGHDVSFAVSDFRRSFLTADYYIHTTSTETIVHDYTGAELHRYSTAADLMAASASSKAFAFVVHGTKNVVHAQLPAGALSAPVTIDAPVWNLALSPDGRFTVATTQQTVSVFLDGALVKTLPVPVDYIISADISNEGLVVLGAQNADQSTQILGMGSNGANSFTVLRPSKDRRGYHPDVRFFPDGHGFVTSERDGASTFNLSFTP